MPWDTLTPQQQAFIERYLRKGVFKKDKNKKIVASYEIYIQAEKDFRDTILDLPADDPRVKDCVARAAPALTAKQKGDFATGANLLAQLTIEAQEVRNAIALERERLIEAADAVRSVEWLPDLQLEILLLQQEVSNALSDAYPGPAAFSTANDALNRLRNARENAVGPLIRRRALLVERWNLAQVPAFAEGAHRVTMTTERGLAEQALTPEVPPPASLTEAERALDAFDEALTAERERVALARAEALRAERSLADPPGVLEADRLELQKLRDRITTTLADPHPLPEQFGTAAKLQALLAQRIRQAAALARLGTGSPKVAEASRSVMEGFAKVLGDTPATPELVEEAKQQAAEALERREQALNALALALKMPQGTPQEIEARRLEIARHEEAHFRAEGDLNAAKAREDAAYGTLALTRAMETGPLSPHNGRPLSPDVAGTIVAAYGRNPRVAEMALGSAVTARHPDKIASGLGKVLDLTATNFESAEGMSFTHQGFVEKYAGKLLEMGGHVGGDYFDSLAGYIASGGQFEADPLNDKGAKNDTQRAQKRSVALAKALLSDDPGQSIQMVDHLRFSPRMVVDRPAPAMLDHALKTVALFQDPVTGGQVRELLDHVTEPKTGVGRMLVRDSLGMTGGTVGKEEVKISLMAAMLKPLDQGPVGSCFATAPVRRMRETEPLKAMRSMAEIVVKGTYKPVGGEKVQAITRIPPDEDPIQRSWEYTLATSVARAETSIQKSRLNLALANGIDDLRTVTGDSEKTWKGRKGTLLKALTDDFELVYDATSKVTDATDGSSSTGRFIVVQKSSGKEIRSEEDFRDAIKTFAITQLGIDHDEKALQRLDTLVGSAGFMDKLAPPKKDKPSERVYTPWELSSGGHTDEATKALFGEDLTAIDMIGASPETGKKPEGERTTDVLTSFLGAFEGRTDPMVTIRTVGRHGFNALPSHPSLDDLKGDGTTSTQDKIKTELTDKAKVLAETDLDAERAGLLFDRQITEETAGLEGEELRMVLEDAVPNRPTTAMRPAEISRRVLLSLERMLETSATRRAERWSESEKKAGRIRTSEEVLKRKNETKGKLQASKEGRSKGRLAKELGVKEFVIADTNWGSGKDHTFFVIAPDPVSGEPIMWKKVEPPGSLTPAGREWVDDQWTRIDTPPPEGGTGGTGGQDDRENEEEELSNV